VLGALFKENMNHKDFAGKLVELKVRKSKSAIEYGLMEPIRLKALENTVELYTDNSYLKSFGFKKRKLKEEPVTIAEKDAISRRSQTSLKSRADQPVDVDDENYYYEYDDE
jgi:hypothetical protein